MNAVVEQLKETKIVLSGKIVNRLTDQGGNEETNFQGEAMIARVRNMMYK